MVGPVSGGLTNKTGGIDVAQPKTTRKRTAQIDGCEPHVCFGSKADMCAAIIDVRFTPNNDRESGFPHKVMFALPPKADMCSASAYVCFGPKADIRN
jgi:hypothetical protein